MGVASIARFLGRIDGRVGVGHAGTGDTACEVHLAVGRRGGTIAAGILGSLAVPSPHHVPFLVCTPVGDLIRPATVMVNQMPVHSAVLDHYVRGPAQLGVAEAVDGAVGNGVLPPNLVGELTLLASVSLPSGLGREPVTWPVVERVRESARSATRQAIGVVMENLSLAGVSVGARRSAFVNEPGSA